MGSKFLAVQNLSARGVHIGVRCWNQFPARRVGHLQSFFRDPGMVDLRCHRMEFCLSAHRVELSLKTMRTVSNISCMSLYTKIYTPQSCTSQFPSLVRRVHRLYPFRQQRKASVTSLRLGVQFWGVSLRSTNKEK